jgi:hypothetical protein
MSIALLTLLSCGREITETDVKMVGVGYHPDEIGAEPELYGGYVEYDYVNFAGGGLSLGGLGLVVYDEVGIGLNGFVPPYAAVYGIAFIFDEQVPAPDAHHGNIGVGPNVDDRDACWTNFEPFSYLMASTVELGDNLALGNEDGSVVFEMGRNPEIYPPDPQDVFVYYIEVQSHHSTPFEIPVAEGGTQILRPSNWQHGAEMTLSYPGGIPPREAPVSSIPRPSTSIDAQTFNLPNATTGLGLSWNGPSYLTDGTVAVEGEIGTCVRYLGEATPGFDTTSCADEYVVPMDQEEYPGQIYTGPWDTSDGSVTFNWDAGENPDEVVTLNIRFLGPVDRTADTFVSAQVPVDESIITDEWDLGGEIPQGYRNALACDDPDDVEWRFDPTYETSDGGLVTSLQGDPSNNLAEVSCRLMDDGEFTLTNEHLARGLEYATAKGAEGAVFYFSRSTDLNADVPAVKDQANYKRDIGQVKVRAHTVDMGRFWVSETASFEQGL